MSLNLDSLFTWKAIAMNKILLALFAGALSCNSLAQSRGALVPGEESAMRTISNGIAIPDPAPNRYRGEGPFDRLIIKDVMLISGEGAPPRGPVTIVVANDRIESIVGSAPDIANAEIIEGNGMYALPGFIDAHTHIGTAGQGLTGPITPPEYVFKLWMAHGITTVREVGAGMGLDWTVAHRERSESGEITAPRLVVHSMFPGGSITTAAGAEAWVREVHSRGADGVKLRGATRAATQAIYDTARELGMGTSNHHDQTSVYTTNVLDSARLGLDSMEH